MKKYRLKNTEKKVLYETIWFQFSKPLTRFRKNLRPLQNDCQEEHDEEDGQEEHDLVFHFSIPF